MTITLRSRLLNNNNNNNNNNKIALHIQQETWNFAEKPTFILPNFALPLKKFH